ncbi:MAG: FixH family protein [Nitrospira sp.]|nr:FixH family protein [Nitrospira sp.]
MKQIIKVMVVVLLLTGLAFANILTEDIKSGDMTVRVIRDAHSYQVGANEVLVELVDKDGHKVSGADVYVYYFMPSMPAMNYTVKAEHRGGAYAFNIKLTMSGEWVSEIRFKKADGEEGKAVSKFKAGTHAH